MNSSNLLPDTTLYYFFMDVQISAIPKIANTNPQIKLPAIPFPVENIVEKLFIPPKVRFISCLDNETNAYARNITEHINDKYPNFLYFAPSYFKLYSV